MYPRSVLLLVIYVCFPWTATHADEARDKALAAIAKLGGNAEIADCEEGKPIYGVDLTNTRATDELLKLSGLKTLRELSLGGTKVSDQGLKELAGFKALKKLDLSKTNVTDSGLKELAGLKSLRLLRIKDTKVTDKGIAELQKQLPDLVVAR